MRSDEIAAARCACLAMTIRACGAEGAKTGLPAREARKTHLCVLDGELAVPCNPEPAIPGSNSHPRTMRLIDVNA